MHRQPHSRLMRWYGVLVYIASIWLVLTVMHGAAEYMTAEWWPTRDDVPWWMEWARSTLENLQSEAWQIGVALWFVERKRMQDRYWLAGSET